MKRIIVALALITMCISPMACSTMQVHQSIINSVAIDTGYAAYRIVPDARPILTGICALGDMTDASALTEALKDRLAKIWVQADSITSTDAHLVVLGMNNLVGLLGIDTQAKAGLSMLQGAVTGLCTGVKMAQG